MSDLTVLRSHHKLSPVLLTRWERLLLALSILLGRPHSAQDLILEIGPKDRG